MTAGGVLLAIVLALTQPWLLWVDEVAEEQLPTVDAAPPANADTASDTPEGPSEDATGAPAQASTADPAPSPATSPTAQPPPPAATGPVELATGSFISRDHTTSGDVTILQLEDGSRVLTIEDLRTDNGPDLFVYLDDASADAAEGEFDDGIDLGALRGNVGDLVYEIPDEVDLDGVASVGIWCDRFSSLFGAADLSWG